MIRAIIGWAIQSWLSKSLPKSAALVTKTLLAVLDEVRERGEESVTIEGTSERPRVIFHPHDPGAKPLSLDDIFHPKDNV